MLKSYLRQVLFQEHVKVVQQSLFQIYTLSQIQQQRCVVVVLILHLYPGLIQQIMFLKHSFLSKQIEQVI